MNVKQPKIHNPIAKELQKGIYRSRIIKDKKKEASRDRCRRWGKACRRGKEDT